MTYINSSVFVVTLGTEFYYYLSHVIDEENETEIKDRMPGVSPLDSGGARRQGPGCSHRQSCLSTIHLSLHPLLLATHLRASLPGLWVSPFSFHRSPP